MLRTLSLLLAATVATANAASFTTFTVPGCGQTAATAINNKNVVVGSSAGCGAFIRDAEGHFTSFTVDGNPTIATGINIHGAVVGSYSSVANCPLPGLTCVFGYVRSPSGVITTIDQAGSPALFAQPFAINASGQIAGTVTANTPQAFFRDVDGTFTLLQHSFQEQGFKGGVVTGLTNAGKIAGAAFLPVSDLARAFIRAPNGTLNIVGPVTTFGETWVIGINNLDGVVGYVNTLDNGSITTQGFTQTATGAPQLFPVPFTALDGGLPFQRVVGGGINSHGAAVLQNIYIAPDGTISKIDLGACQNVVAEAINNNGWVTGRCGGDAFLWRK